MTRGLLITGTIGTGKSTVAADLVELLKERGVVAAAVDLDWLCWAHVDRTAREKLVTDNLRAFVSNFAAVGVSDFVLTRAITTREELDAVRAAFDDAELSVVRLTTPPAIVEQRLRARDSGAVLEEHLTETRAIDRTLDQIEIEDFSVANAYGVRTASEEIAGRLGWV